MIVCLCHRVSESDIQRAVRDGAVCFDQVQDETRVASSCGACHDCACETFDAAVEACGGRRALLGGAPVAVTLQR